MNAPSGAGQTAARPLRRALVLGGAGFMGSWVTRELDARGIETTILGYGAQRPRDAPIAITRTSVDELLDAHGFEAVFFLAGSPSVPRSVREPSQDLHDNAGLVIDVLESLRSRAAPPVLVFASSAAVYGDSVTDPMDEGHPLTPRSPYGISKLAAEHYVRLYSETYDVPAISVRPFSVYGPGQRKLVIYDLLRRLLAGEDPLVIQSPSDVARDFVFVRDVARAIVDLASIAPAGGEAYNLASGIGTTLSELAQGLVDALALETEIQFTGTLRTGDPLRWRGDPSRAQSLGISCATSLAEGLAETARWVAADVNAT